MLACVKPHVFLSLLLESKGLTDSTLASAINLPKTQGTINKFLAGGVKNPRSSWVKPAAKHLNITWTALVDEDAAEQEAQRLGLLDGPVQAREQPTPAYRPRQAQIDPGMLVLQIADLMRAFTPAQREIAAPLFQGAAKDPDEATNIAAAIRALLASPSEKQRKSGAR